MEKSLKVTKIFWNFINWFCEFQQRGFGFNVQFQLAFIALHNCIAFLKWIMLVYLNLLDSILNLLFFMRLFRKFWCGICYLCLIKLSFLLTFVCGWVVVLEVFFIGSFFPFWKTRSVGQNFLALEHKVNFFQFFLRNTSSKR